MTDGRERVLAAHAATARMFTLDLTHPDDPPELLSNEDVSELREGDAILVESPPAAPSAADSSRLSLAARIGSGLVVAISFFVALSRAV